MNMKADGREEFRGNFDNVVNAINALGEKRVLDLINRGHKAYLANKRRVKKEIERESDAGICNLVKGRWDKMDGYDQDEMLKITGLTREEVEGL